MSILTRDAILGASDAVVETVEVPEWGGSVQVRGMTAAERDTFEASLLPANGKKGAPLTLANLRARLVVRCVIGEDGARLFTDDDAPALGEKNASAVQRVFNRAQVLSGMSDADVAELAGN